MLSWYCAKYRSTLICGHFREQDIWVTYNTIFSGKSTQAVEASQLRVTILSQTFEIALTLNSSLL